MTPVVRSVDTGYRDKNATVARSFDLPPVERRFECFFNFLGWWHWSCGLHVDVRHPHIDLHVPFGFARIGWFRCPTIERARAFGRQARWE
jgi:hypothetical protein